MRVAPIFWKNPTKSWCYRRCLPCSFTKTSLRQTRWYHERTFSYPNAPFRIQSEQLWNVHIASLTLSKNILPYTPVSQIKLTGLRKCTHLQRLPFLPCRLLSSSTHAKKRGGTHERGNPLPVLLCLHTSVLAATQAPAGWTHGSAGSWPNRLAINIAGRSYYPATWEEAEQRTWRAAGQWFGVGRMQINNWWMERFAGRRFSLLMEIAAVMPICIRFRVENEESYWIYNNIKQLLK